VTDYTAQQALREVAALRQEIAVLKRQLGNLTTALGAGNTPDAAAVAAARLAQIGANTDAVSTWAQHQNPPFTPPGPPGQ
jgi:hypothetical protein